MSRLLAIPALATEAPAEGLPTGDYLAAAGTHELLWLLVALPLAGAAVLLLGGRRTNSTATPALLPDGSEAETSVSPVLERRSAQQHGAASATPVAKAVPSTSGDRSEVEG